jgi:hypothetical protein
MLGTVLARIILYLVILAVGTYVLFLILEIAAIPIPSAQTYLSCPQGTTIKYTWVRESWNQPGETTMEKACIDNNGKERDGFSDDVYGQREYDLFMPISFVIMLVGEAIWLVFFYIIRKRLGRQEKSS